mmetsp:Transcript_81785/g.243937  ORF Transcript_81785/g.243937 Transcript_81785/m.243937 type:complete len:225 (+) Transcript_81785:755-1429(+)
MSLGSSSDHSRKPLLGALVGVGTATRRPKSSRKQEPPGDLPAFAMGDPAPSSVSRRLDGTAGVGAAGAAAGWVTAPEGLPAPWAGGASRREGRGSSSPATGTSMTGLPRHWAAGCFGGTGPSAGPAGAPWPVLRGGASVRTPTARRGWLAGSLCPLPWPLGAATDVELAPTAAAAEGMAAAAAAMERTAAGRGNMRPGLRTVSCGLAVAGLACSTWPRWHWTTR